MPNKKRKFLLVTLVLLVGIALVSVTFFVRLVKVPTGAMKNTILPGDVIAVNRRVDSISRGDLVVFRFPKEPTVQFLHRVIGLPGETLRVDPETKKIYINEEELVEQRVIVEPQPWEEPGALKPTHPAPQGETGRWSVYYYDAANSGESDVSGETITDSGFHIASKGDPVPDEIKGDTALRAVYDSDGDGRYDADQYLTMGDNRDNSLDGRFWGTVPRTSITGKPFLIYWSSSSTGVRWERVFSKLK